MNMDAVMFCTRRKNPFRYSFNALIVKDLCMRKIGMAKRNHIFTGRTVEANIRRTMTREQFIQNIEDTYQSGVELIKIKNKDYAGVDDPFKNFRSAEIAGINVDRAILVRILDKMSRISNLLNKDAQVRDEKLEDTLLDAINYLAILKVYREQYNNINTTGGLYETIKSDD